MGILNEGFALLATEQYDEGTANQLVPLIPDSRIPVLKGDLVVGDGRRLPKKTCNYCGMSFFFRESNNNRTGRDQPLPHTINLPQVFSVQTRRSVCQLQCALQYS